MAEFPITLIHTSGEDVGLGSGMTGNSEVDHQNIGAGRIVFQNHQRISNAITSGRFFDNEVLCDAVQHAKDNLKTVHLMGIASASGVHGVLYHLYACLEVCRRLEHERVCLHLFTDGRDSGPFTGAGFVDEVATFIKELGIGCIASVIGRYWAMDRDNRWERIARAYSCLTGHNAEELDIPVVKTPQEALELYYERPSAPTMAGDEFVTPTIIAANQTTAEQTRIREGDTVLFYNYRGDRPREITRAFVFNDFYGHVAPSPDTGEKGFDRGDYLNLHYVTMTQYDTALDPFVHIAFPKPKPLVDIAGRYLSNLGLRQFRCAETEKYPHVTFFFNDYRETPFEGETHEMVQSPMVQTYDMQPEMSADGVCKKVIGRLNAEDCEDFIVVNFANADMVGHTGSLEAAIKAVETTDRCVGEIIEAVQKRSGCAIITADHGNAEQMWDPINESPHTSHTLYDVILMVVGDNVKDKTLRPGGRLADVLPTAFDMMGLAKPKAMSGETLLIGGDDRGDR